MSAWDEVRNEHVTPRGSPLPWMLLFVSILMTVGVIVVGKSRLDEERNRTAAALKANDEVQARLRAARSEQEKLGDTVKEGEAAAEQLSKRIVTLELQVRTLEEELDAARGKKKEAGLSK